MPIERVTGLDDENYGFDELVATDAYVHIERMSNEHMWMMVTAGDRTVTLNFHVKKRSLWVNVDQVREPLQPLVRPELTMDEMSPWWAAAYGVGAPLLLLSPIGHWFLGAVMLFMGVCLLIGIADNGDVAK